MTEIMTVSESFSYSKSEFEKIPLQKKSSVLVDNDAEDESTLSFNSKSDIACEKSSDSTICGSDDSAVSDIQSPSKLSAVRDHAQDSTNSTVKSDLSYEDRESLTTETTVMSATNSISHPDNHDAKLLHDNNKCTSSRNIDNKRVVVQILTSRPKEIVKPEIIFVSKSTTENQCVDSFRDDVCKLLTKPGPTLDYGSDTIEDKEFKDVSGNSLQQADCSQRIARCQRRRGINPFRLGDRGPKFCDIKRAAKHIKTASASSLRIIHFMLYDKYGLCSSDVKVARTRRRILLFSGYPFDRNSKYYRKRFNSLLKIPYQMLLDMHEAIFGKTVALGRYRMINNLITVFFDTKKYSEVISFMEPNIKIMSETQYSALKSTAESGPVPVVLIKKLRTDELLQELKIEESELKIKLEGTDKDEVMKDMKHKKASESDGAPSYVLQGPGRKLKRFSTIVHNVKKATIHDLNLLHYLLFGRTETVIDNCQKNILEFSGFKDYQDEFMAKMENTLKRMSNVELYILCKLLCLQGRTNSTKIRIKKILYYLKAPFNPIKIKGLFTQNGLKCSDFRKGQPPKRPRSILAKRHLALWDGPEDAGFTAGSYCLRDFAKICSNIECSAPSDLVELNDLLFLKNSDETEIHDKILNFNQFGFPETSMHYHSRKTLLFYMGLCIVRKIGKLLDIENWEISSQEDLSTCILNFLMQRKNPETPFSNPYHINPAFAPSSNALLESPENFNPVETPQNHNQIVPYNQHMAIGNTFRSPDYSGQDYPSDNEYFCRPPRSPVYAGQDYPTDHRYGCRTPRPVAYGGLTSPNGNNASRSPVYPRHFNLRDNHPNQVTPRSPAYNNQAYPSDSEYYSADSERRCEMFLQNARNMQDDSSVLLRDFIHHPTDQELKSNINTIVRGGLFEITLGDVVKRVYELYPHFNLVYREGFIKSETRKIVSGLRQQAVNTMQGTVNTVHEAVNPLKETVHSVHGAVSTVHGTVNTVQGAVSTVHGTAITVQGAVSTVHGTANTVQGTVSTMQEAFDTRGSSM